MPYLNSRPQALLWLQIISPTRILPFGNYFMLTTGNIETNNDAFTGTVSSNSIPRAFGAAGEGPGPELGVVKCCGWCRESVSELWLNLKTR